MLVQQTFAGKLKEWSGEYVKIENKNCKFNVLEDLFWAKYNEAYKAMNHQQIS
jgi:hypothetical protein